MIPLVSKAIGGFKDIVKLFKLTPEQKAQADAQLAALEVKLQSEAMEYEATIFKESSATVRAEIASKSWLASNWRPITMLTFLILIVLHWFGFTDDTITEGQVVELMDVVKIALGGYVIGRSAEKIIPNWPTRSSPPSK